MVRFFCPGCWKDFTQDLVLCPSCGLNIHEFRDSRDRVEKLILALHHPVPSTPVRAAWLLGKTEDPRAVKALVKLFQETHDVYIAKAVVKALGETRASEAVAFLKTLTTHPAATIRREVERILAREDMGGIRAGNRTQPEEKAV